MAESTGGTGTSDSWQLFWGCRQQHSSFLALPLHFVLFSEAKHTKLSKEREFFELRSRRSLFSLGRLISRASSIFCCLLLILLFIFMNSRFFLLGSTIWLLLGVLLIAVMIKYASFQQNLHRPQAQVPTGPGSELHMEEQVNVPTFVTREQLPDIRIQLAQLNREFDDSDYDALRALDEDIAQHVFAMSEEDINALPIYKYQVQSQPHTQVEDSTKIDGRKFEEKEFTCSVCMELVYEEELIRRLPCSHEFHASCIFPWLQQRGTCPICKRRAASV